MSRWIVFSACAFVWIFFDWLSGDLGSGTRSAMVGAATALIMHWMAERLDL